VSSVQLSVLPSPTVADSRCLVGAATYLRFAPVRRLGLSQTPRSLLFALGSMLPSPRSLLFVRLMRWALPRQLLTFAGKSINMALVKTTLTLPDDVFRKAKARAALRGQSFGKFLEQSLQRTLSETGEQAAASNSWLLSLPRLPRGAAADLQRVVESADFRAVDQAMWQ